MDPDACAAVMRDETADPEDRREAHANLKAWMERGGFPPSQMTRELAWAEVAQYDRKLWPR